MKLSFCILALAIFANVYAASTPTASPPPFAKRSLTSGLLSGAWFQIVKPAAQNACQCSQVHYTKVTENVYAVNTLCLSGEEKGMKVSTMRLHSVKLAVDIIENGKNVPFEYNVMKDQLIIFENRLTGDLRIASRENCLKKTHQRVLQDIADPTADSDADVRADVHATADTVLDVFTNADADARTGWTAPRARGWGRCSSVPRTSTPRTSRPGSRPRTRCARRARCSVTARGTWRR